MIKILFFIHDLGQGGAEKVLVNLVNNLDFSIFEVTLLSLFGGGVNEKYIKKEIRYKYIFSKMIPGNSKFLKLLLPSQLHNLFIKEQYDIEVSYLEGVTARIISGCPNSNTKLVSWIHVEQHTKNIASIAFRNYKEAVECYSKYNGTVCVSDSVKLDYQKLFPMIKNVTVLYNTNETDIILQQKDEDVKNVVFNENEIKICGVGKIMPIKGFDKLARIHKRLRDNGYPVHTYILGIGSDRGKIEKYIKKNKLQNTFTFLGYQTNPYKYIAKCDLFVCTSIAEGFSTAATESLIVGTPVITTPVAGMTEMLGKNNEYGVITEMSEDSMYKEIQKIIQSPKLLEYYKKQARLRGEYFKKNRTVKEVENFLINIL